MDFRERIIRYRSEKGLSQQELADLLQVSRQTVSRWESGKSRPQPGQAAHIFARLQIEPEGDDAADFLADGDAADVPADEGAAESGRTARPHGEAGYIRSQKVRIALLAVIGALLLAAVVGLILTIVYAVKDSMYDAGATVWIITIPQNTPMLVLSAFLAVFIALLVLLLVYLLRGKKR